MNAVTIRKEKTAQGGRYVATVAGKPGEAELTFAAQGAGRISADHTIAPAALRGTGAALALVEHMVEDARKAGFKIVPVCSYVVAQFERHPEWHDVMASA